MLTSCVSIKPVNKNLVTFLTDHCPFLLNIEFLLMSLELRPFPDYRRRYNTAFLLFLFVKFITKINITPKKNMPRNAKHDCDFGRTFFIQPGKRTGQSMSRICSIISRLNPIKSISVLKYLYRLTPLAGPVHSMSAYYTGFT